MIAATLSVNGAARLIRRGALQREGNRYFAGIKQHGALIGRRMSRGSASWQQLSAACIKVGERARDQQLRSCSSSGASIQTVIRVIESTGKLLFGRFTCVRSFVHAFVTRSI